MTPVTRVLFTSSAAAAGSIGYLWSQHKSKIEEKTQEAAVVFWPPYIPNDNDKAKQLIVSKQLIASAKNNAKFSLIGFILAHVFQTYNVKKSFYDHYLENTICNNPSIEPIVFAYEENYTVIPPVLPEQTCQADVFINSGPLSKLHNWKSFNDILNNNFVICKSSFASSSLKTSEIFTIDFKESDFLLPRKRDFIITGTKDCEKCEEFHHLFCVTSWYPFSHTFEIKDGKIRDKDLWIDRRSSH